MLAEGCSPSDAANWFINDIIKYSSDKYLAGLNLTPVAISELIKKVADKTIQRNPARLEILPRMMEKGMTLADAAKDAGIELSSAGVSRDAIRTHLLAAMSSNPKAVEQYRAGQKDNTKWFIGQIMRPTKGQASVEAIQAVIIEELGEFKSA
jgi:aspartyl-tRNA(Asn)/glutamyl-tRNA(Gln) amidotransferase subunit B